MGHVRIGELPRTRRWRQVVDLIGLGAGTLQLANATMSAAEHNLQNAGSDKGLIESFWLLTQLPHIAKSDDYAGSLNRAGMSVRGEPGLMELAGSFSDAVDHRMKNNSGRTDIGEMAQAAAVETISKVIGGKTEGLFKTTPQDIRNVIKRFATVKNFGELAHEFFSKLTNKYLEYHLSRELPNHVGEGRRFTTLKQQSEFKQALSTHCHEAAKIVEQFSGEWVAKVKWERGSITRGDIGQFIYGAMTKIRKELKAGAGGDA